MEISVKELQELLKAFNKDNNGIVAIKTGESEKNKPESFLNNEIFYSIDTAYNELKEYTPPTVTGGSIRSGKNFMKFFNIVDDLEILLPEEIEKLQKEKQKLYGEIRTLDNENVDLKRKLDISQKENQKLKAEIENLEQKKINLEVDLEEQKSLVNTTRKLWEKLEKENQELKSKWYFWQVEAEKKETNNQELKAEIEYIKMHYVKIVQ